MSKTRRTLGSCSPTQTTLISFSWILISQKAICTRSHLRELGICQRTIGIYPLSRRCGLTGSVIAKPIIHFGSTVSCCWDEVRYHYNALISVTTCVCDRLFRASCPTRRQLSHAEDQLQQTNFFPQHYSDYQYFWNASLVNISCRFLAIVYPSQSM